MQKTLIILVKPWGKDAQRDWIVGLSNNYDIDIMWYHILWFTTKKFQENILLNVIVKM